MNRQHEFERFKGEGEDVVRHNLNKGRYPADRADLAREWLDILGDNPDKRLARNANRAAMIAVVLSAVAILLAALSWLFPRIE